MASWGRVVAGVVIGVAGTIYATNEDVRKKLPKAARDLPDNVRRRYRSAVAAVEDFYGGVSVLRLCASICAIGLAAALPPGTAAQAADPAPQSGSRSPPTAAKASSSARGSHRSAPTAATWRSVPRPAGTQRHRTPTTSYWFDGPDISADGNFVVFPAIARPGAGGTQRGDVGVPLRPQCQPQRARDDPAGRRVLRLRGVRHLRRRFLRGHRDQERHPGRGRHHGQFDVFRTEVRRRCGPDRRSVPPPARGDRRMATSARTAAVRAATRR